MIKKRANGLKYSKITKQQKYLLLRMCLSESKSLQEVTHF